MQRLILEICIFAAVAAAAASAAAVGGEGRRGTPTILTSPSGVIRPQLEPGLVNQTWIVNTSSVIYIYVSTYPSALSLNDHPIKIYEYSQDDPSQSQLVFTVTEVTQSSALYYGVLGPVIVKLIGNVTQSSSDLTIVHIGGEKDEFLSAKSMQPFPMKIFLTNESTQQCAEECTQVDSRSWMMLQNLSHRKQITTVQLQKLITQSPADNVTVFRHMSDPTVNYGLNFPIGFWNSESKQPFQPITVNGEAIVMWMRDVSVEGEREFQFTATVTFGE